MSPWSGRKSWWVLPIVFAICAVMVLPGAAILAPARSGGASAASSSVAPATTPSKAMGSFSTASLQAGDKLTPSSSLSNTVLPSTATASSLSQYTGALSSLARTGSPTAGLVGALAQSERDGQFAPSTAYLPDLSLLESGATSPSQNVGSGYQVSPAPMGISDIGIGGGALGTPYAYNTSHFLGSITINSANATYPGAFYFMGPESDGYYNTPYEFGIQLNTVVSNISIPGSNDSVWWTQNVVALNGNTLTFEDNVWNFSSSSGLLNPGSLYSYNGTAVYPEFYYDYGPTIQLSFPVTIDLYNNASVVNERDQVTFGYRVVDSHGTYDGVYDTVVFNNPWASPALGDLAPPFNPGFQVNGQTLTPLGLNFDAELIFGGPGGGTNADFNQLNATETLSYSNQSSGGWQSVPSAYDWGPDTGETSIGVAETWYTGGVVNDDLGPSFLYGLWNSQTTLSVPEGSIQLAGTISPSYGFVFAWNVGETYYTNASLVPTDESGSFDTYVPPGSYQFNPIADGYGIGFYGPYSSSTTGLALSLSPSPGFLATPLYLDGNAQAEAAAAALTGWTSGTLDFADLGLEWSSYALLFDHLNDWGYVEFNLFQATGVTDPLEVNDVFQGTNNVTNDDYGYSVGFNTYIMDVPLPGSTPCLLCGGGGNDTYPQFTWSLPNYGSEIAFYGDGPVTITDETAYGYYAGQSLTGSLPTYTPLYNLDPAGGAEILWATPNAVATNDFAADGSYGVYDMGSDGLNFNNGLGVDGSNAVSVVDSAGAVVNDVTGAVSVTWSNNEGTYEELSFGAWDFASDGGVYTNITGAFSGVGFADFGGVGATVTNLESYGDSLDWFGYYNISAFSDWYYGMGATLTGALHTTLTDVYSDGDSVGITDGFEGPGSLGTTIVNLYAEDQAVGFYLYGSAWTNITNFESYGNLGLIAGGLEFTSNTTLVNTLLEEDYEYDDEPSGIVLEFVDNTTFVGLNIVDSDIGIFGAYGFTTTFDWVNVSYSEYGVEVAGLWDTTIENANVTDTDTGFWIEDAWGMTLTNDVAWDSVVLDLEDANQVSGSNLYSYFETVGFVFDSVSDGTFTNVVADADSTAVLIIDDSTDFSVNGAVANGDSTAVEFGGDINADATVTDGTAGSYSVVVETEYSAGVAVTDASSTDYSAVPVAFFESNDTSASDITVIDQGVGVLIDDSEMISVSDVTVSGLSIGVWSIDSDLISVNGVTATGTTVTSPWTPAQIMVFGYCSPGIAAVLTDDDGLDSIENVTATTYPAAYYDTDSYDEGVANVNATGGYMGIVLDDTWYSTFTNLGIFQDFIGVYGYDDAQYNVITMSSFVDDSSYAIAWFDASYNLVYLNDFVGNNGAGATYSAAHIQVYSGYGGYNYWDGDTIGLDEGNYWSDWHTYNSYGELAPYPIGDGNFDYYPLGGPEGTVAVYFYASGLASGTSWSITLGTTTQSTTNDVLTFYVLPGSYAFSAAAVSGYAIAPGSGTVTATGASVEVDLTYTAQFTVTVTETGLPTGDSWEAIVGGTAVSGTTASLSVVVPAGETDYQIVSLTAGYTASPASGSIYVTGTYALATTFSAVTYAVTVSESGLASGQAWSATVNGETQSTTGTSITFYLPNGTATISIGAVKGYSVSESTVSVNVTGAPTTASVTYSSSSTPALVSQGTFNAWLTVALAIAVIALIAAILALMMRRKGSTGSSSPPQQWSGPSSGAASTGASGGETGAWSEGAGPATPPPPSS
jgi:hypothetical protein